MIHVDSNSGLTDHTGKTSKVAFGLNQAAIQRQKQRDEDLEFILGGDDGILCVIEKLVVKVVM